MSRKLSTLQAWRPAPRHKTLMPDNLNIQITSQIAMAATTM
jgi:hypothetical protein